MIGSAIRLCGLVLVGWIIVFAFAAVLGVSAWISAAILIGLALLAVVFEEPRQPPEPPPTFEQTGGFPRSRR